MTSVFQCQVLISRLASWVNSTFTFCCWVCSRRKPIRSKFTACALTDLYHRVYNCEPVNQLFINSFHYSYREMIRVYWYFYHFTSSMLKGKVVKPTLASVVPSLFSNSQTPCLWMPQESGKNFLTSTRRFYFYFLIWTHLNSFILVILFWANR